MQSDSAVRLIESRIDLVSRSEARDLLTLPRKLEAEGGCGVIGTASSMQIEGRHFFSALYQMRNRGNGKGGGVAVAGLSPESLGVSKKILDQDYLLQIAYTSTELLRRVEKEFVEPVFKVDHEEEVGTIDDFRGIGLEVKPPDVKRYFVQPQKAALEEFLRSHNLADMPAELVEDEFVYRNSYQLNRKFYSPSGTQQAFVLSHGKNMLIFKLVGRGEQAIQYYKLEDFPGYVWIGHHRYPTKGRVWHPGGAHPFIGMHEALVHNGDFANYASITEYLKQRNIEPLFLTDTEVSVLLFDLWNRVYQAPLEYVLEAMAPTTERDFEMLPEWKKAAYRTIQSSTIHGSPDGPWFFIIARNDTRKKEFQLIGITDTSMLRPQVFALQEGEESIGLIASEKQAIDALLASLYAEGKAPAPIADHYWNARGGSYTDGGAFIFSVDVEGGKPRLICRNKFGRQVATAPTQLHRRK